MSSITYIYGIKSHNSEIRYVGATTRDITVRLAEHFFLAEKGHTLPHLALEYGVVKSTIDRVLKGDYAH